jgi:hypothetical protein
MVLREHIRFTSIICTHHEESVGPASKPNYIFENSHAFIQIELMITCMFRPIGGSNNHTCHPARRDDASPGDEVIHLIPSSHA